MSMFVHSFLLLLVMISAYQVPADNNFRTGVQEDLETGDYLVTILVGPTTQTLKLDTGSNLIWVQSLPCSQCFPPSPGHSIFDPDNSNSIDWVPCADNPDYKDLYLKCFEINENQRGCDTNNDNHCTFDYSYEDGSSTKGFLASETLTLGNTSVSDVTIGCGHANNVSFAPDADGVLGLGWGSLSLANQSGRQAGGAFSYCLGKGSGGWLEMSRSAFPTNGNATWISLIRNPKRTGLYYIDLVGLVVKDLPVDAFKIDLDSGGGGVTIDTGVNFTLLNEVGYGKLLDAFRPKIGVLLGRAGDTCYDVSGVDFEKIPVPSVEFVFSTGGPEIVRVAASNVLIDQDDGTACFGFGWIANSPSVIGNKQLQGTQMNFDTSAAQVSFIPNVC